ncbi:MAG: hypothetical protein Kow0099_21990 [Candidatus Abyssubacteria bacterium]
MNNGTPRGRERAEPVEVTGRSMKFHLLEGRERYELRIDYEGRWYHEGVEIVRDDIRTLFSRNLRRDKDGGYYIEIGRDEAPVVVEDAPFVVLRVTEASDGLSLLLSDGTLEPLDPRTLTFTGDNVPYCRVRGGLEARFSRAAYYQLARFISYDEHKDTYCLNIGDDHMQLPVDRDRRS